MGRFKDDFPKISKGIGFKYAVELILKPRLLERIGWKKCTESKLALRFIKENFSEVIEKYIEVDPIINKAQDIPNVIWVFWWQGSNMMPPTIKVCYNQLLRNANGREIVLLTEHNYKDYVKLPSHILDKFNSGNISFPHFSDIVRCFLLKEYGGLWIDAAVFVTKPITLPKLSFYTPVLSKTPQDTPHLNLWVIGCMGASPNHPFFSFLYECLIEYWSKFDVAYNYLFLDYFIRYGYEHFSWIKKMIDDCPFESPDFFCRYLFKEEVDYVRFEKIIANNNFIGLTYRVDYPKILDNGKETYYNALLRKYNLSIS